MSTGETILSMPAPVRGDPGNVQRPEREPGSGLLVGGTDGRAEVGPDPPDRYSFCKTVGGRVGPSGYGRVARASRSALAHQSS